MNNELQLQNHMRKAENAMKEARILLEAGFYDGARSRATVSSIQAFTAATLMIGNPNDPQDLIERVKAFVASGRLPEGADLYFTASIFSKRDADEGHLMTTEVGARKSYETGLLFLDSVKEAIQLAHEADVEEMNTRGMSR